MAKPIKETPFLYGNDAAKFIEENNKVEKISIEEKRELKENYEALKSIFEVGA
ncbi:hypothetical protein ACGK9U_00895 [Mariniflexile sp. HNIBRBA6329]|uniref:hypothetical protein n=1 Tax=Mariniflexile sp. HNIBRBA6329 TaxID=3373088 RepID=UPI0037462B33